MHDEHIKYSTMNYAHEAGYDSLITAKLLIRLSAKLEAAGEYTKFEDNGRHTPSEGGGVLIDQTNIVSPNISAEEHGLSHWDELRIIEDGAVSVETVTNINYSTTQKSKSKKRKKSKVVQKKSKTAFSHAGRFDLLEDLEMNDESTSDDDMDNEYAEHPIVPEKAPMDDWQVPTRDPPKPLNSSDKPTLRLMPPWDSDFWNVYGNLLRVNGTVEGVCDLAGGARR